MSDEKDAGKKKLTVEDVIRSMAHDVGIKDTCIDLSRLGENPESEVLAVRALTDVELDDHIVDPRSRMVTLKDGSTGIVRLSTFMRGKSRPPTERWMLPYYLSRGKPAEVKRGRGKAPQVVPDGSVPTLELDDHATTSELPAKRRPDASTDPDALAAAGSVPTADFVD